jgi:post-segregation antitoxin (ccd killing protein)
MRMARVNVYLPDDLAAQARAAGLNVSRVTQEALRERLRRDALDDWLDGVSRLKPLGVTHDQVLEAIDEARAELGDG